MNNATNATERELREDLVDTLLAVSLLTKRMARSLAILNETLNAKEGDYTDVKAESTGCCPCRTVHAG